MRPVGGREEGRRGMKGFRLTPDSQLDSVRSIDPAALGRRGIRLVVLDVDNTLTTHKNHAAHYHGPGFFAARRQALFRHKDVQPCLAHLSLTLSAARQIPSGSIP